MNASLWLQHPYLLTASGWLLAAILLFSAFGKLRDLRGFIFIVQDYQILPKHWARRFAAVLPWLEGAVGLMLLFGLGTRLAAGLSGLLLLSFTAAVGVNLLRERQDLNCGCAGARHRQTISRKLILRNVVLLLLAFPPMLWGQDALISRVIISAALAFVVSRVLLVGGGLPFVFVASGSLMFSLLIRQMVRFAHREGR